MFEPQDCSEDSYDRLMTVIFNLADNGYIARVLLNQFFHFQDIHYRQRAETLISKQKVNGIFQDYYRKRRCYLRDRIACIRVFLDRYGDTFQEVLCMHHPYYYNLWSKLNRSLHVNSWILGEINEEILTGIGLKVFMRIHLPLCKKYTRGSVIDTYDQFKWYKHRQQSAILEQSLICNELLSGSDIDIVSVDSSNAADEFSDSDIEFPPLPFNI